MMKTTIDMSPQAVTNRMIALDELWELTVALKSSKILDDERSENPTPAPIADKSQNSEE
jgi:hypothetical protein